MKVWSSSVNAQITTWGLFTGIIFQTPVTDKNTILLKGLLLAPYIRVALDTVIRTAGEFDTAVQQQDMQARASHSPVHQAGIYYVQSKMHRVP